ncbi:GNAT family N-acetyltransferase [Amphibacillus cookii]|uniref:GNAT family N-acetyltransferase n=1 Tax=Amphibacillus cookii TaxID=767787 RepID=UPI00195C43E6|nr:GNAT family N-acetyltransferase [Amphibacillus cookii]MBM7542009.1 ribosomal protein S18 acetylase RimI-like enzyme [Amphibacillus cookii]
MTVYIKRHQVETDHVDQVINLLYSTDPDLHQLGFGKKSRAILAQCIEKGCSYFSPKYLYAVRSNQKFAGITIFYSIKKVHELNQLNNAVVKQALSKFDYYSKKHLNTKISDLFSGEIPDDYYYIHCLAIEPQCQRQGLGSKVLQSLKQRYARLALYVNERNERAMRFYLKNGFRVAYHAQMRHRGKSYGVYLMLLE